MFKTHTRRNGLAGDTVQIYAAAFESAPSGALLLHGDPDRGAMILRANAAAREITGRSEEELRGAWLTKSGLLLSTPEEFADSLALVQRVLLGDRRRVTVERQMARADGDKRLLKMTFAPLESETIGPVDGYDVHAVMHIEDITEQRQAELELEYRSGHDSLTDLMNRRRFTETLIQHLAEGRRYGYDGALLMVDLDSFKQINEDYGQKAGDAILKAAACSMRSCLRGSDYLARMGGNEFAILLPSGDIAEAERVADKLLGVFRNGEWEPGLTASSDPDTAELAHMLDFAWAELSLSIGIVALDGSWPDPDAAYSAAYSAMRAAKAAGGDGIAIRHGRRFDN
jgi:diguanylate cyclase (GGDEF)-like protein/PAS domain S-box-containing protein